MKLLFVIHSLAGGGAERVTSTLANYWSRKGWEVTVLTIAAPGPEAYALDPAVRQISLLMESEGGNLPIALRNNIQRIRALRRALRQFRPDAAIAMMTKASVLLAFAAYGMPDVAAIGSERTYPPRLDPHSLWGVLRKWSYGKLTAVVAQTEDAKAWLQAHTHARRIVVIPNAPEWPMPSRAPVLNPRTIVTKGARVLLAAGRLDPVKGFDWLIEAFAPLARKHPDWKLVILGNGPQRAALEWQISRLGLDAQALLPGAAGNVAEWYSSADLFVLSSRYEGFPNALVEALAHGLPAVGLDCHAGPRDIIRDGVDGWLIPAGDVQALTSALDQVMSDDALRRGFAQRAVEARERFSLERIAAMWEALFRECRDPRV